MKSLMIVKFMFNFQYISSNTLKIRSSEALASYIYSLLQIHRYNELLFYEMKEASSGESLRLIHSLQQLFLHVGNGDARSVSKMLPLKD